jgi:phosphatidylglycerophosphatase GEP4
VEEALGVSVLRHTVKKPAGGQALLQRFENIAKPHQIAMVGDRLFTDILFGNLNGTRTILTRQIISDKGDNQVAAMV